MDAPGKIYTISEINRAVYELLEGGLPELWVEGEISNCKSYPSGHTYLTLKDEDAQIRAVLFKGDAMRLKFRPEDGLKILARGRVSSYIKRGDVQFIISAMEPREKGALQAAFEQLKAKLAREGLFDEARKKPLPEFPGSVGVITSLQGAAIHDMVSVMTRRWPAVHIAIRPVKVQGEGAAADIAQALADLNAAAPPVDVILVGRGGGSLEDLWAFNEELVARAIAASGVPVVSCVGHETDFTIADFAADRRAPTPSAAAELAVPDGRAVAARLEALAGDMEAALRSRLQEWAERLSRAASHPLLQSPRRIYEETAKFLDELWRRLEEAAVRAVLGSRRRLILQAAKLDAISPLKVLGRGYAIAEKLPGREIIRSFRQVSAGEALRLRVAEGSVYCEVTHGEK